MFDRGVVRTKIPSNLPGETPFDADFDLFGNRTGWRDIEAFVSDRSRKFSNRNMEAGTQ